MATFAEFAESNINGYSFVAAKASPDAIAGVLEKQPDVLSYERDCSVDTIVRNSEDGVPRHPDGSYLQIAAYPDKRTSYIVQTEGSQWCVLLRTVDWVQTDDCDWVQDVAKLLATRLSTTAIAVAGDYACDVRVFEATKLAKKKSGDLDQVAKLLAEYKIDIPDCSIAEDPARLFATNDVAKSMKAAHRIELSVDRQANAEHLYGSPCQVARTSGDDRLG